MGTAAYPLHTEGVSTLFTGILTKWSTARDRRPVRSSDTRAVRHLPLE
jgi:hypothetical protein